MLLIHGAGALARVRHRAGVARVVGHLVFEPAAVVGAHVHQPILDTRVPPTNCSNRWR